MQVTGIDRLLWMLGLFGHSALLVILILRKRYKTLPVFTAFVLMNIIRTLILYVTNLYHRHQYFNVYWSLAVVDVVLQLLLAFELATHVFRPLGIWAPDVRRSFLAILASGLLIAIALTWLASPPTRTLRLSIALKGDLFESVLLSELFVAMIALSVSLGLPWRTHVARVAQGIGFFALIGLITDAARSYFGTGGGPQKFVWITQLQSWCYILYLIYWSITLAQEEPAPRKLPEELHNELRVLQSRAARLLASMRG